MTKRCFKCKRIKPLELFYKHKDMADGHLNKCKYCTKKDIHARYYSPGGREKIIAYEKKRALDPERRKRRTLYQRRMRANSPGRYRARRRVQDAIRTGRLVQLPCRDCGDANTQAHHTDYRRFLVVIWLCRKHHMIAENKIPF